VLSWLFPRAAHWILDRNQIKGQFGQTLLRSEADEEEDEEDEDESDPQAEAPAEDHGIGGRDLPNRQIYHLDLRSHNEPAPYVDEIRRIAAEATVQTVDLLGWIGGSPKPEQIERFLRPAAGNVAAGNGHALASPNSGGSAPAAEPVVADRAKQPAEAAPVRVAEETGRRWYPVIDYSRCTNCMECLDFCLFGVYGVDRVDTILVEQPDNCRKGCPACSRVCPENAIIFPQHKTPAIAGSPDGAAGGFKIDLSVLFGAPDALQQAVVERDVELVAAGRDAVGASVGMPKRQAEKASGPKDDLDQLMDQLDDLGI
jgi:NAD-dependent dihydropyrimidine dehydrogenase PreA subunit